MIRNPASGIFHYLKRSNSHFTIDKDKFDELLKKPLPDWMRKQLDEEFAPFRNIKITSKMLKETLKDFWNISSDPKVGLAHIIINKNKASCANMWQCRFHPRLVRFLNFMNRAARAITFPDVEFLFSLSDHFEHSEWQKIAQAPIFVISKKKENKVAIMIPHVEWAEQNELLLKQIEDANKRYPWEKKIDKIFWRGSTSGEYDLENNPRLQFVKFSNQHPEKIDAGFSSLCQWSNAEKKQFSKNFKLKNNLHPHEQVKYKYLVALDGNVFPGSFYWQLFTNCIVLKQESAWQEWYYAGLKAGKDYINCKHISNDICKLQLINKIDHDTCRTAFMTKNHQTIYIYKQLNILSCF